MYSPCQICPGIDSWKVRSARLYLLCSVVVRRLIQNRPGILPSIDPGAAIGAGRAGLLLGRQPLHFHVRIDDGVEGARHLRRDPVQAILDERHDLGAALVALRELVARVLGQRLHPVADRTLRVADLFQNRVHLPVQPLQLVLAHLVDLVRRHPRRRRCLERPAVELLAMRAGRDAGLVRRDGALRRNSAS